MSETTKIEWCDATVNFWWGCTKVSPGCANCYAETLSNRFGDDIWGNDHPRKKIKSAVSLAHKLNRAYLEKNPEPYSGMPRRPRVFAQSMSDWLDPEVPVEWLAEMLDTVRRTPHLDWLLLTKRPELWRDRMDAVLGLIRGHGTFEYACLKAWLHNFVEGWECVTYSAPEVGMENYWIGTSVEDQKRADERIPALLSIPAKVRFLSCEPLLGPVSFFDRGPAGWFYKPDIHWVICGGESGPNARPMHPDWARSLRDQCQTAGVPFFFKQWGEWCQGHNPALPMRTMSPGCIMIKAGKKAAGRKLDGREWSEFPKGGEG